MGKRLSASGVHIIACIAKGSETGDTLMFSLINTVVTSAETPKQNLNQNLMNRKAH